jgi:Carboxypeptidase regulatory-like domain
MRRMSLSAVLLVSILHVSFAANAQTNTGEIGGVVRDESGALLPGVTIDVEHPLTGFAAMRISDGQGRFFFPALPTGAWSVTASLPGFAPNTRSVALEIGRTLDLDFILNVEGTFEEVTVVPRQPLLETTTAEISDVIENRVVIQIPINGRNFLSLAQLSDAVVIPPGGTRGAALQQAGPLPNVGGQRAGHNIYLLDGAKVTDELFNNLVINPSVDSIQEFRIQKSMYPVEFGGKASALINVATKSGGNDVHGSAFEFYRDDALDAPNYFARNAPVPPLSQHQFGGTVGGALRRDETFFFASYEGSRTDRSLTQTFSVPDDDVRTGDFSAFGGTICDPTTIPTLGICTPFPNNQIPAGRIDPVAQSFLGHVPRANTSGQFQNLVSVEGSSRDVDQFSGRLDHRVTADDQIFVRFSTFDADELQPFGTSVLQESLVPGFGRTVGTKTRNLALSHTHLFGTQVVNELRFGWLSVVGGQESVNRGFDFAAQTGLQGVTDEPAEVGFPQISTRNLYSTMGDPTSFTYRNNEHFELYENLMLDRAAHRIKFGGYYYHLRFRPRQADNARGAFAYTGQFSGNAFADFLLGYPVSATSGIGRGAEDARTNWVHLYVQDDWRVLDNLTINAGLRYEHNQHMHEIGNRLSSIDLSVPGGRFVIASDADGNISSEASALLSLIPIPYVTSAEAGWDRGLLEPSPVRLAPRLGFALTLDDSRTVIRGGYGIFLNQWAYSVQTSLARNLPFFFTRQVDVPLTATVPARTTADILTGPLTGTIGASIMNHAYKVEYSQTWSGGVQHQIDPTTVVEASYMGTWTVGADNSTVHNVPLPGPGPIQDRRPIPELSHINAIRFDGKSIYHALTFRAERRPAGGVAFNLNYTVSTSKDDASSPGPTEAENNRPQNVDNLFGPGGEWAHSSFDHRHRLVASAVWEFPFFSNATGIAGAALGGWRLDTIFTAQSGSPFTVNLGVDQANIGAGPAQRPDQLGDPNLPAGERTPDRWFDTSAFGLPLRFTFGDAPRNSVLGPGYTSLDLSVARDWGLSDASRLEFRWETFNLLNRANFDLPNRIFGTPNFGRIFSADSPREMQLGLRLSF